MSGLISETMLCESCEHSFTELLERDKRDDAHPCPECGEVTAKRTWSIPHVRTAKTSASMVDGTKRFGKIREGQALKKAKAVANQAGDRDSANRISKEINKLGSSK